MSDKPKGPTQEDIFLNVASKVAERYPEFVLLVKTAEGDRAWKWSDTSWALGAMVRACKDIEAQDLLAQTEAQDGAG